MTPPAANPVAGVDQAFLYIIGFSLFFLVFITVLMIYFVIRYRAARHPDPVDIRGNTALEIAWMVIPTLIAPSMFYFGWQSYLGLRSVPPGAIDIGVKAEMFLWTFTYPDGKRSRDLLVVPEGKPVKLNISSVDVIQISLSIPAFRIKMDAVPGISTYAWFMADKVGEHKILCTEYCGVAHSDMTADLKIVPPAEYEKWLAQASDDIGTASGDVLSVDAGTVPPVGEDFFRIEDEVALSWKVEGDRLHLRLQAAVPGWVSVGFNPERRMKGANYILATVADGRVLARDDFGTAATRRHASDTSLGGTLDVDGLYGSEIDGTTFIGFSIPLASGDKYDGTLTPAGETVVLLAHGGDQDDFEGRHRFKAIYAVDLATGTFKKRRR